MTEARAAGTAERPGELRSGVLRVLVVDPRPQSRSILKGALRGLSIVNTVFERGSTVGLPEILAENPVHVVLIEQDLGEENPFDLIRSLAALPAAQRTRFMLVGMSLDDEVRRKGLAAGAKGFLTKPYDLQGLERALREALGVTQAPSGQRPVIATPPVSVAKQEHRDILGRLRKIQIFAEFTDSELIRLLKICQTRPIGAGEYVFREGDKGDKLYVLVSGEVEIRQQRGGEDKVLVTMKPGDCFGEMAIIDSGPRSADAYAALDSLVIEVLAQTVNRDDDVIALKMVRQIAILLTRKIRGMSK